MFYTLRLIRFYLTISSDHTKVLMILVEKWLNYRVSICRDDIGVASHIVNLS